VRKKYARFEGEMRGVDSRILLAQVPGGMLTNMESQLKEQGALARLDEVLEEIPRVRADLGYLPLVTPTSQIVGTQAVLNVLAGERYRTLTKETAAILRGEYGQAPAPFNAELQERVLQGGKAITCRPGDLLPAEWERLGLELDEKASAMGVVPGTLSPEDRLTYALFPQVGLQFLQHRGQPAFFESLSMPEPASCPPPGAAVTTPVPAASYDVRVDGVLYRVDVASNGALQALPVTTTAPVQSTTEEPLLAPLAGHIVKVLVSPGQQVVAGEVVLVMEAMKMEAEIRASKAGRIARLDVEAGTIVQLGQPLAWLA
jgi:oxaloacetate decarboxylase alpha subunit